MSASVVFPAVSQRLVKDNYTVFYSSAPGRSVSAIIDYIEAQGDTLIDLRVERPNLEERFLEITQDANSHLVREL
jgi:ABC-2 type transport system ATP-binding protein